MQNRGLYRKACGKIQANAYLRGYASTIVKLFFLNPNNVTLPFHPTSHPLIHTTKFEHISIYVKFVKLILYNKFGLCLAVLGILVPLPFGPWEEVLSCSWPVSHCHSASGCCSSHLHFQMNGWRRELSAIENCLFLHHLCKIMTNLQLCFTNYFQFEQPINPPHTSTHCSEQKKIVWQN